MQPDYQRFFPDEKGTKTLGREVVCKIASILKHNRWRGCREVEGAGLENQCTARYLGFESLTLRHLGAANCTISSSCLYKLYLLYLANCFLQSIELQVKTWYN